jgi:hypothetical protein
MVTEWAVYLSLADSLALIFLINEISWVDAQCLGWLQKQSQCDV